MGNKWDKELEEDGIGDADDEGGGGDNDSDNDECYFTKREEPLGEPQGRHMLGFGQEAEWGTKGTHGRRVGRELYVRQGRLLETVSALW